jgi:hypothetical protein
MKLNMAHIAENIPARERAKTMIENLRAESAGKTPIFTLAQVRTLYQASNSGYRAAYYFEVHRWSERLIYRDLISMHKQLAGSIYTDLHLLDCVPPRRKCIKIYKTTGFETFIQDRLRSFLAQKQAIERLEEKGCGAPLFDEKMYTTVRNCFKDIEDGAQNLNRVRKLYKLKLIQIIEPSPEEVDAVVQEVIENAKVSAQAWAAVYTVTKRKG